MLGRTSDATLDWSDEAVTGGWSVRVHVFACSMRVSAEEMKASSGVMKH